MADTTPPTVAQLDRLLKCDLSQATEAQCRAFDAVFSLAMEGKPVAPEPLALALAIPTRERTPDSDPD